MKQMKRMLSVALAALMLASPLFGIPADAGAEPGETASAETESIAGSAAPEEAAEPEEAAAAPETEPDTPAEEPAETAAPTEAEEISRERTELTITADDGRAVITLEGVLPTDVTAQALAVDPEALPPCGNEAVEADSVLCAYDVSLCSRGEEYEPENGAVTVALTGEEIERAADDGRELEIWRVEEGAMTRMDTLPAESGAVKFETERLSLFLIAADGPEPDSPEEPAEGEEVPAAPAESEEPETSEEVPCEQTELTVTADDNAAVITLEGVLPTDVTAQAQAADVEALPLTKDEADSVLCAYDISLYSQGEEYEPENGTVTVTLAGDEIQRAADEGRTLEVWHINDDGTKELVENAHIEGGAIVFDADRFSIYIVRDGEETYVWAIRCYFLTGGVKDDAAHPDHYVSHPYFFPLSDGSTACYQTIPDGGYIHDVAIPDETFMGWVRVYPESEPEGDVTADTKITYNWPQNPQTMRLGEAGGAITVDENTENIYLAPLYSSYGIVAFYEEDENPADDIFHIHTEKFVILGNNESHSDYSAAVNIGNVIVNPADSTKIFAGWKGTVGGAEQEYTTYNNDTGLYDTAKKITVSASDFTDHYLKLTPVFASVYWLTFDVQAEDAAFVDAIFADSRYGSRAVLEEHNSITSLTDYIPKRPGYVFLGWYSDPECTTQVTDGNGNIIDGSLTLTENTTLYAKWKETEVTYTIVYWQQSIDERNTPESLNADKLYDYYMSETFTGTAGDSVSQIVQEKVFAPFSEKAKNKENLVHGFHLRLEDGTVGDGRDGNLITLGYYYDKVTWDNVDTSCYACTDTVLAHDSSTVINVYYDRNIIQVVLNYRSPYTSSTVENYGLYKQPYPGLPELDEGYYWKGTGSGNSYQQALQLYDLDVIASTARYNYRTLSLTSMSSGTYGVCFELMEKDDGTYPELRQISDYPYCELVNPADAKYLVQTDMLGSTLTVTAEKFEGHILQSYATDNLVNWQTHDGAVSLTISGYNYFAVLKYARLSYDLDYFVDGTNVKTATLKYHAPLADCNDLSFVTVEYGRHLISETGWYADPECTVPFDFGGVMPASNVAVYTKTLPNVYTVTLDPGGGKVSPGSVSVEHGGKVVEDITVTRDDPAYRFLGWYEVDGYGDPTTPFLFSDNIVTKDITLKAVWQHMGNYYLNYVVDAKYSADGVVRDPHDEKLFYQDAAATVIRSEPTPNSNPDGTEVAHVFAGWQIEGDPSGRLYQPGETLRINAAFAAEGGLITLTAVYTDIEASPKTDATAKLIIDGNGGAHGAETTVELTLQVNEQVDLSGYIGYYVYPGYVQTGWALVPAPGAGDMVLHLNSVVAAGGADEVDVVYAVWKKMPAPTDYRADFRPWLALFGTLTGGAALYALSRRRKTRKSGKI